MQLKKTFWLKVGLCSLLLIVLLVSSIPERGLVSGDYSPSGDYKIPPPYGVKNFFLFYKDMFFYIEDSLYNPHRINFWSLIIRIKDGSLTYIGQCGDGVLNLPRESCDDGNLIDEDGCNSACQCKDFEVVAHCPEICGDGIIIATEECDDSNIIDHDGCSSNCVIEELECGNLILEIGEECDGGPFCNEDCTLLDPRRCFFCGAESTCNAIDLMGMSCPPGFYDNLDTCRTECDDSSVGVPVPPGDDDIVMCEEPNPLDLPEGARFRDVEGGTRHISICEMMPSEDCSAEDCARYIICRPDGGITVNVIPCPAGSPCEDGACFGDPTWHPACLDSDGGITPSISGRVWTSGPEEGGDWRPDYCATPTSLDEGYCVDRRIARWEFIDCTDFRGYCNAGACVSAREEEITCSETDEDATGNGNNPFLPGITTITTPAGSDSRRDACTFDMTSMIEKYCYGDSMETIYFSCNLPELCEVAECRCEDTEGEARCVPGELPGMACVDEDEYLGARDIFTQSSAILLRDGSPGPSMGDNCFSENVVGEAICVGTRYERRRTPCPPGYNCFEGACVGDSICRRTEATATTAGYVTDIFGVIRPDICIDESHLEIYGCDTLGFPTLLDSVDCSDFGTACRDGLCRGP